MLGVAGFVHHVLQGEWGAEHDIPDEVVDEAIERGLLWDVLTYLGLHTERAIGKGEFEFARERIELVRNLWERFGHDLGRSTVHALTTYLRRDRAKIGTVWQWVFPHK